MNEEEKKVFEASLEGLSEEEKTQKRAESEEALSKQNTEKALAEERKKRIEAEEKLEETRRKAKERWDKTHPQGEDDDKPLTKDDLTSILSEQEHRIRKEVSEERAKEIALKLTNGNQSQADLDMEVWKNRTLQGTLDEQLAEAHAIATYKQSTAQTEELKRALAAKGTGDGLNSQKNPPLPGEPKINDIDKTVLKGYVWDGAKLTYKKTIAGGRKILYVSKDLKKRWTESV